MERKFILSPDCFLWHNGADGLVYNSRTGESYHFHKSPSIGKFCEMMDDMDNLYTFIIGPEYMTDTEFTSFLSDLESLHFGRMLPAEEKTVSLPPHPFIVNNADRIAESPDKYDILGYLSAVTIYLGGSHTPNDWFRQTPYPFSSKERLTVNQLGTFLSQISRLRSVQVQIVVSDGGSPGIADIESLSGTGRMSYLFSMESCLANKEGVESLLKNGREVCIALSPEEILKAKDSLEPLFMEGEQPNLSALVNDTHKYKAAETLMGELHAENFTYMPVWDGKNGFYKDNVLPTKEDVLSTPLSKRKVFIHQTINLNYWGQFVFP